MKGFKEFIMRGNVIELAVAVVMGAAFTSIVTALVQGIFNPIIAKLFNADDISKATLDVAGIHFGTGAVIAAIIQFLLIAAVIYFFLIMPMNKLMERAYKRKHGHLPSEAETEVTDHDVLIEIRDLLAGRSLER